MRCVFLGLFAILAYTTAMCYEPEPTGYSVAEVNALNRLVEHSARQKQPGASRRDIAELFGREDVR